jgi:hypothetical protein
LIKAQEAETEDKVYQIGEISQKTGLQKTANGWVKPKNGKQPGAATKHDTDPQTYIVKKNDELRRMYLNEKDPAKKEAMKKALKKQASMMEPEPFSSTESKTAEKPALSQTDGKGNKVEIKITESKGGGFYVDKYVNGKKVGINNANTRESAEAKAKSMMEQHMTDPDYRAESKSAEPQRSEAYKRGEKLAKPAEQRQSAGYRYWQGVLSGYDDESLLEQRKSLQEQVDDFEDDIKRYDKHDMANAVYAKRIDAKNFQIGALKAIDEEMENRGMDPAPRTAVPDAAPRVLTGDTRIRVRKA